LRARLSQLGADESNAERKAHAQAERLTALNAADADLRGRLVGNQASLTKLLAALQMYQRNPPPALLVSPRSAKDAVNAAILMRAITPELRRRAAAFAVESRNLNALRRQILIADGEFLAAEREVADRRDSIDALNDEKAKLEGRGTHSDTPVLAGSVDDLLKRFESQDRQVQGPVGALHLQPPVHGALVHRFGDTGGESAKREGVLWAAAPGAQALSPAAGKVAYAGPLKGWGGVLILNGPGAYHLVIAGLDAITVRSGDAVLAGEPVGRVARPPAANGRKGAITSDVYLEVRQGISPVDPARFLGKSAGGHQ
jgi:septal ring factor EnvC (AmiA/AmiB activator)